MIAHQFDIVAITETFLDSTIHDSHIVPPGYAVFRKDRDRHGSLVADNFLTQAVYFPTRGNNVLDVIFINVPEVLSCSSDR